MNNEKEKNADDLINQLCDELEPTSPRCPYRLVSLWVVASLAYLAVIIFIIGLRMDFDIKLSEPLYIFEMVLALSILLSAALASSWLSFPDCVGRPWIKKVPITLSVIFLVWVIVKSIEEGIAPVLDLHMTHCAQEGMYMEIIPLIALVIITMKGRTTEPYWSMTMNVLAVSTLGWIGLRLTCSMDEMGHSLFNHLLPFSILAAALGLFARKLFKW